MKELTGAMPDGINYHYYRCERCGEEIVDMRQLHEVAGRYRAQKKYQAKVNRWGASLGVRIPSELARKYSLKEDSEVTIIPEEGGIRIILA
jgi:hypothetical protein